MTGHLMHDPVTGHLLHEPSGGHLVNNIGDVDVTFVGNVLCSYFTTYFYGGTYLAAWRGGSSDWYYAVGVRNIRVYESGGTWYCRILVSWGPYGSAGTEWSCATKLGTYAFYQSLYIGAGDEDNVTAVSVAAA